MMKKSATNRIHRMVHALTLTLHFIKKNVALFCIITFVLVTFSIGIFFHGYPERAIVLAERMGISERFLAVVFSRDATVLTELGHYHFGGAGTYDLTKAEEYYKKARALEPTQLMLNFNLARIAFLDRRFNEALMLTYREERLNPDLHRIYYLRGLIYGYDNRLTEAEEAFETFVKRDPAHWAGYLDLSWIYFRQGKYQEVLDTIGPVLETTRNAWLENAYGLALLNLGEKDKARFHFLQAQRFAENLGTKEWGVAYGGNDPALYERGLTEMRHSLLQNVALTD